MLTCLTNSQMAGDWRCLDPHVALWHQTITWINVDLSPMRSSDNHLRAISQEIPHPSITTINLEITFLKIHSNLPGANKLIPNLIASRLCNIRYWNCLLETKKKLRIPDSQFNVCGDLQIFLRPKSIINRNEKHNKSMLETCATPWRPRLVKLIVAWYAKLPVRKLWDTPGWVAAEETAQKATWESNTHWNMLW